MTARALSAVPLEGRPVLVTGAGGFIGASLVRALVREGAHVVALTRARGRMAQDCAGALVLVADLLEAEHVREIVSTTRPEVVFHLAAQPDARETGPQVRTCIDSNVTGTANLLEAMRELDDPCLVYGDSSKVYGNSGVPFRSNQPLQPLCSYAVSKAAGWSLIDMYRRVHGLRAMSVRPTLVYGPEQGFNLFSFLCDSVWTGKPEIPLDGGQQTRDPLYIDDAVDAFIRVAEFRDALDGRVMPVGGGRELSVLALAELTVSLLNGKQPVVPRPAQARPTEMLRSWSDNAEIEQLIGWRPRVSLEQGILRTAAWLRSMHKPIASIAPAAPANGSAAAAVAASTPSTPNREVHVDR